MLRIKYILTLYLVIHIITIYTQHINKKQTLKTHTIIKLQFTDSSLKSHLYIIFNHIRSFHMYNLQSHITSINLSNKKYYIFMVSKEIYLEKYKPINKIR